MMVPKPSADPNPWRTPLGPQAFEMRILRLARIFMIDYLLLPKAALKAQWSDFG